MAAQNESRFKDRFYSVGRLVVLGGILVTIFSLSAIIGMRIAVRSGEIRTPALVGMLLEDAREVVESSDLQLQVTGRRYNDEIPAGSIVSQIPGPGVGIKGNRKVRVVVSLGRRVNPVPNLTGSSIRAARIMAQQNGYELGRITEIPAKEKISDDEIRVVAQYPPPESGGNISDQIDILVETRVPESYIMPDMAGKNLNRVLRYFKNHGFDVNIRYRRHQGVQRGVVVRQFPEPGYRLKDGQEVILEVAR